MLETDDVARVLRAGGIAPHRAKLPKTERAGAVGARAFTHPALPGRTVVRLTTTEMAPGVDVEMETLGFGAPAVTGDLGWQRYRALGFPGWALVNDPSRAKFALEVMKDFKKAAARVKSKPGHARDAFVAIGDRLARSVPHFLPSFWEEAGRAFLAEDATSFAAQAFEKARTAEKEHDLTVDEDTRGAVFLEFALAGAIAAKTLSGYGKILEKAFGPRDGYARFFELARRRTLGGMPPWTGMPKDLRALAKAAKLDVDAEDERFLAETLDAPALAQAPADLWTTYDAALVRLAKRDPDKRDRLRHVFPKPPRAGEEFKTAWIDLLERAGALEAVTATKGPEAAREAHGMAAEWLGKALAWAPLHPATGALVPKMADRLKAEGVAVQLAQGTKWYSFVGLDACEHALALGVPVEAPLMNARFALDKPFTVDPVHVAAEPRFQKMLEDAVGAQMGQAAFEAASKGKKGFVAARRAWVQARIDEAKKGTVVTFMSAMSQIAERTSAATFAELPEAKEAFLGLDVAHALARHLRGGHVAELTWPAFEEAVVALGGKPTFAGFYPYPIVHNGSKVIVLGAPGRLLEHDLRLSQGSHVRELFFVPDSAAGTTGQLLVAYWDAKANKSVAYWSGSPNDVFDWDAEGYYAAVTPRIPGAGGISFGARAFAIGDTRAQRGRGAVGDGARLWILEQLDYEKPLTLREIDPVTGEKGKASLPAPMAPFEGAHFTACTLQAIPPGLESSPFGIKDGVCGSFTFRDKTSGKVTLVTADGRTWEKVLGPYQHAPTALLALPGDDRPRAVQDQSYWSRTAVHLFDADGFALGAVGEGDWTFAGWPVAPPSVHWLFARPRDDKGSVALRAVTDEAARALLEAARPEAASSTFDETTRAVAEKLPAITDPKLRAGIAAVVHVAAQVDARYRDLVKSHVEATHVEAASEGVDDQQVRDALGRFLPATWERGHVSRAIAAVSAYLEGGKLAELPPTGIWWETALGRARGLAFYALSPGATDDQRRVIGGLLDAWRRTVLARELGSLRVAEATMTDASPFMQKVGDAPRAQWVCEVGPSRYFVRVTHLGSVSAGTPRGFHFVERTTDGAFHDPPKTTVVKDRRFAPRDDAAWLEGFVAALAEKGPPTWDGAAAEELARRTGLTRTEAALLWAGLPKVDDYAADFLGKDLRTALGVKQGDAKAARDTFRALPMDARLDLLAAAAGGDDPRALWSPLEGGEGSPVARLAAAWIARSGQRAELREELVVACEKALDLPHSAAAILGALVAPEGAKCLEPRAEYGMDVAFQWQKPKPDEGFSHKVAQSVAPLVPWLFVELPVGDPYRAALPGLWEAVKARLFDPRFVAPLESRWGEPKELDVALDALGGESITPPAGSTAQKIRDTGLVRAELHGNTLRAVYRPAKVTRYGDEPALVKMAGASNTGALAAIAFLLENAPAFLERIADTPVPAGGYEGNPALSAPDVVAEAAAKLGLDPGAAALYLQLLALAEPTQKNVIVWNGWKPAEYKKHAEALAAKRLVVTGKRERAGREIFLPGGWEKRGGSDLPLESWKLPLYTIPYGSLGRLVPPRPLHRMFADAWARVAKGDAPKYEEV